MRTSVPYKESYYLAEGPAANLQSAKVIVPIVYSLVRPKSVVDVGCGSGAWLSVFREHGVYRILGLDGDYVDPSWLVIPRGCFRPMDLSRPFDIREQFDLAVCLEVAEHLPRGISAEFIRSLVRLAPIILFSAAVPHQGGTHHINEQWPDFWSILFQQQRYVALDLIRKEIWKNPEVKYWYRQNIFLYVREDLVKTNEEFVRASHFANDLWLVHASILERHRGLLSLSKALPKAVWGAARRFLRRRG